MSLYPIFLKLENRKCVVFGGGQIATRKVEALLKAGADVTVISPDLTPTLFKMWAEGKITCHYRPYRPGDIRGFALVISATNLPEINQQIVHEAQKAHVFTNVVDVPEQCDFYVPAVMSRGALQIAISTSGTLPGLAREIRKWLEDEINDSFGELLHLAAQIRQKLKQEYSDQKQRQQMIDTILLPKIMESLRNGGSPQKIKEEFQKWI